MSQTQTRLYQVDAVADAAALRLVEARIQFFGSPPLRSSYSSYLRELNDERQRLRVRLARALNGAAL